MNLFQQIKVSLGERSHEIFIGSGLLEKAGPLLKDKGFSSRAVVITNPEIRKIYGGRLRKSLKNSGITVNFIDVQPGEDYKNLGTVADIYDVLVYLKIERGDTLIALGGGVVGDLAGFVAATYLRGINFIQIPTTLLAQVDSSIGGKVGVNLQEGKNLIGAFYQPKMVIIDIQTLATLPLSEIRAGLAEAVKYGVIWDRNFFSFLEDSVSLLKRTPDLATRTIAEMFFRIAVTCAGIKAKVIEKDEKEKNLRMILNFGHSIGHGIEAAGRYKKYNHGQAVSLGMLGACLIGLKMKLIDKTVYLRLENLLKNLGLPVKIKGLKASQIYPALAVDKKVKNKKIRLVLPQMIGKAGVYENITTEIIMSAISDLIEK